MIARDVLASAYSKSAAFDLHLAIQRGMKTDLPLDARLEAYEANVGVHIRQGAERIWVDIPMRTAIAKMSSLFAQDSISMVNAMRVAGAPIDAVYEQILGDSWLGQVMLIHDAARHGAPEFLVEVLRLGGDPVARATCRSKLGGPLQPWLTPLELAMERTDEDAGKVAEIIRSAAARNLVDQVLANPNASQKSP